MSDKLSIYLSAAWEAARLAGTLIRETWEQPKSIDYKGAVDLVTSVDREAERRIVEVLQANFPSHSILAEEESSITGTNNGYRWIIDPLDGTTNFAHGYPHFCISIAMEIESVVVLGLVYDPLRHECFRAVLGQGASVDGNRIQTSATRELDKALLGTGFPYDRRINADEYLTYFKAFMLHTQGIRRSGSAALDLCYVACGRLDGFWELKLRPWDIAAGSLIVSEAGGRMSDFHGREFRISGIETLASNGTIHAEMVDVTQACATRIAR